MRIKNILLIIAAITIVSCNCARDSEVYKLLQDVKSYIDEKPDSALAVLNGIDKDNLNNKALKAHYEYVWWNAKMKYNIPPDVESTRIAYDYYTGKGASSERFLCHLYRGIYYLYQDDYESAMLEFSKAEEDYDLASYAMQGLLHTYKDVVYHIYFDYDNRISELKAAADRYLKGYIYTRYVESIIDLIDCYITQEDTVNSAEYIALAEEYMEYANEHSKHSFSISKAKFLARAKTTKELLEFLDEYIETMSDSPYMQWRILAYLYDQAGSEDKALFCIEKEAEINDVSEDPHYYAALALIKEELKDYKGAIEAYKKAVHLDDSLELIKLNRHVQLIEEKYDNEMARIEAVSDKRATMLIAVIVILIAFIFIYFIRRQLKIRTAEKKQLEIEKKRYEQLYADAIAERDALTKMIEENTVNEGTKVIIERRLELLNKVIVSYITDTSAANRKANEELEALVSDRDMFITSTRMTLESSHPAFFRYLREKELTDWEINYCCLYLIGLKGKDIGEYINLKRHYTYGSVIRQKLGLTENDTNLSIHLKKLLENPQA